MKLITPLLTAFKGLSVEKKKVFYNINWLLLDNFIRIGIGFFVGAWMARYLGPEQFGLYSFALAFVLIFSFLTFSGIHPLIVQKLVRTKNREGEILGSLFILKLIGGIAMGFIANTVAFLYGFDQLTRLLILILSSAYVFHPLQTFQPYFESRVEGKVNVIAMGAGFAVSTGLKIYLLFNGYELIEIVMTSVLEAIFTGVAFVLFYRKTTGRNILDQIPEASSIINICKEGAPLFLASILYLIYGRADQLMIGTMLGYSEIGNYSVAASIYAAILAIGGIIGSSIFPAIIASKEMGRDIYEQRLRLSYGAMSFIAISIGILGSLLAKDVVNLIFGYQYALAGDILSLYIWATIPQFYGIILGNHLIGENKLKHILYIAAFGCSINIILNYFLIGSFGVLGSALALIVSAFFTGLPYYFFKDTHEIFIFSIRYYNPLTLVTCLRRITKL